MAKPGKTIKRSARAIEKLSKNTGKRADEAQAAIDANTYDANMFARHAAGQTLDMVKFWLDLFGAARNRPPEAYIEIVVTGSGSNTVSASTTVDLDEPVAMALLQKTDLVAASDTIPDTDVTLTAVPPGADPVEVLSIQVTVPNNQAQTLYRGFVSDGAAVQVEVSVSVHT